MSYNSKYTGQEVEELLDQVANGGGGITQETDPIFSASPAAKITDEDIEQWKNNGLKTYVFDAGVFDNENPVDIDKDITQDELNEIVNADFVYVKYEPAYGGSEVFVLLQLKEKGEFSANYHGMFLENVVVEMIVRFDSLSIGCSIYLIQHMPQYINTYSLYLLDDDIYDNNTVDLSELVLYDEVTENTIYGLSIITSNNSYILQKVMQDELANDILVGQYGDNSILKLTYNKLEPNNSVINIINRGTYSKPSTGIPKSDLASAVQTSLGKADTALQSYTEQYKGTVTGVKMNGTTKNPSSGVVDLGTVITAHQDISGKQDKLVSGTNIKTINGQSLLGSGNIVIEGGSGGSSSGGSGAYAEVNHGTSDTTFTLTPNTFHVWDEVAILDLSFGAETSGVANEYLFQFTSGATATTLTLPDDIKWANDSAPTIAENMIYQISVLRGLASVLEFRNAVALIENKATISNGFAQCTVSFAYPVASEITVKVRSDDGPETGVFSTGDQTKTITLTGPSEAHIESITPIADSMYIYTF